MLCVNPGAGGKGGLDGKVETSELTVQTIQALVKDFCFLLQLNAEILALQAPITSYPPLASAQKLRIMPKAGL